MVILEDDNDYEDIYRLLKITTGELVIGKIVGNGNSGSGIILKDPVTVECTEDNVFFNIYLNGLAKNRNFFFPALHIIAVSYVDQLIKDYYDNYLENTLLEIQNIKNKLKLANNDIKMNSDTDTIH